MRYIAAALAVLLLVASALAGLAWVLTTEQFALAVNAGDVQENQQKCIETHVSALTQAWGLSPETLAPSVAGAARRQSEAMAAWWSRLWRDPDADAEMPAFLDPGEERNLVAAIMADEGFAAAVEESQRRAVARDEIAYGLDEAVCEAVTPLRRSIVGMAAALGMEKMDLTLLPGSMLIAAGALLLLALPMLAAAHRALGSTLAASGVTMALLSLPVWWMDICGMLAELSPLAALQGANALRGLAILWYGAALVLLALGMIIIGVKKARGGRA